MTARNFLIRGLLAGVLAGFVAFLVAHQVGEPHVDRAIAIEEAASTTEAHTHAEEPAGHSDEDEGTVVSRDNQSTWGLATGTLAVGTALGGLVALVAAGLMGRVGRLRPGQSTAVVAVVGFVAIALVPFLKYPATPPAVGNADTIGSRTGLYFTFLLISLIGAVAGTALAQRVWQRSGAYAAVLSGAGLYLVVVIVAGLLMPTVNEVGDFPADTLWYFRVSALMTLAAMWATIGVVLTGLVGRLHQQHTRETSRRELAAFPFETCTVSRAMGLAVGYAADRMLGDPARHHPVAGFGQLAAGLERRMYADSRARGAAYTLVLVGSTAAVGTAVGRATRGRPALHTLATAATTWAVLGGASLGREATAIRGLLAAGDLAAARSQLTHLVGRDTSGLDTAEITRATVESLAENTSDAVVAPLLAGAFGGIGGLAGYRAANTLDAMVGHRSPRHQHFGWASARLDDLLNLAAARLTAWLAAALAPTVGGRKERAITAWRRDAPHHPSPNAGPVEASFAGALGVTLGGRNTYGERVEERNTLGDGPPPEIRDIERAHQLADRVGAAALAISVVLALRPTRRRRQGR